MIRVLSFNSKTEAPSSSHLSEAYEYSVERAPIGRLSGDVGIEYYCIEYSWAALPGLLAAVAETQWEETDERYYSKTLLTKRREKFSVFHSFLRLCFHY